jgi:hypothetical protein
MDPKGWRLLERMQQVSERVTPGGRDSGVARPQVSRHGSIGVRFRMSI